MNLYIFEKYNRGTEEFNGGVIIVEASTSIEAQKIIVEFLHDKIVGTKLTQFPTPEIFTNDFVFIRKDEEGSFSYDNEYKSNVWMLVHSVKIKDWLYEFRLTPDVVDYIEYFD